MNAYSILLDILHVKTSVIGIGGAFLLHMIVWFVISDYDNFFGVAGLIRDFLRTTKRYKTTITRNMLVAKKDEIKAHDIEEPGLCYIGWLMTFLHHSTGGLFILAGILTKQTTLVRHGMLVEAAGLDTLDLSKMLYCVIYPPGPYPQKDYVKNKAEIILITFHHTVALTATIPVMLYFSENSTIQVLMLVLLGGPSFGLFTNLVCWAFVEPEQTRVHGLADLFSGAMIVYQRDFYFFPTAYSVVQYVISTDVPLPAKVAFCYSAFAMSVVNIAIGLDISYNLYMLLVGKSDSEKAYQSLRQSVAASITPAEGVHLLMAEKNVNRFFIASKLITKAKRAKKAVKEKDGVIKPKEN